MPDAVLPKDFLWGVHDCKVPLDCLMTLLSQRVFAETRQPLNYRVGGAPHEDGRADSIWGAFCRIPGEVAGGSSGDVACGSYHRTQEDIALPKQYRAKAYRLSISWSRIIHIGGRSDPANEKGLQHYV